MRFILPVAFCLSLFLVATSLADDASENDFRARATAAIERGLPLVGEAAQRYPQHRQCFSCHHQTLPMLAIVSARSAGLKADAEILQKQGDFTYASFEKQLEDLRAGKGIGGKALTVSYGLWSLGLAGRKPDQVTEAMVAYLLKTQDADGHWGVHTNRPPIEESFETTTVLSIIGLKKYATEAQKTEVEAALAKARTWFAASVPESQEDRVSKLWSLKLLADPPAAGGPAQNPPPDAPEQSEPVTAARAIILAAQRDDGGWAQLDSMSSDAYATGQTLCVLFLTGTSPSDPACRRALEYLLSTQSSDGSWFVKSRSKPVQVYFDNGDPHGHDQFISTPASCWALVALAMSVRQELPGK